MVRRLFLGAVAVALLLPAGAQAQTIDSDIEIVHTPRLRIAPWAGWLVGHTRSEDVTVTTAGGTAIVHHDLQLGGGLAAGLIADVNVVGPFNLHLGGGWATRGDTRHWARPDDDDTPWALGSIREGSDFVIAKAGLSVHLFEPVSELQFRRLAAVAFVAPAYMREMPRTPLVYNGETLDDTNLYGVNIGFDGEVALGSSRFTAHFGLEDYLMWWDNDVLVRRTAVVLDEDRGDVVTRIESGPSNMFLIRAGVSYRIP